MNGYFRSTKPHIALEQFYPNEFHIDIDYEAKLNDDEWLKQYDIIHYHRTLGPYEKINETINRITNLGIITIMDLDDYWAPGPHHPAYLMIKKQGIPEKIVGNLKAAKNITTTTDIFADEISKLNKNVFVIPNAIDPNEKQYKPKPEESDRIRIGWLGGSSHMEDLKLLEGVVSKLKSDGLIDKIQFVLCGYDLRGVITMIDEKTGQQTQRAIKPHESVWFKYEQIFTDNFSIVSEDYKKHLLSFTKEEYEGIMDEPYRRVWTKPISTYASNYNLFDISLAPLSENLFNKVKSQLKVIEAGFHKKALIAQDFGPYQIDLVNAYEKPEKKKAHPKFNTNGNAYLIPSHKNHKQWYQHLKKLITNPEQIEILSNNLHETVKDTYSLEAVSKRRRDLYLELLNKK